MIFVIGLGIIFAAAMIVCVPLLWGVRAGAEAVGGEEEDRAKWEKQKREAYSAIKEADLDFQMGKLAPDDYRAIRTAEESRALEALRALENKAPVAGGKVGR
jgi:hypothetical protein